MVTAPKLPPHSTPISPKDYFTWEAEQELRYEYFDVSITCDARDRSAKQFSRYPCLIIKVLSPGTEAYDRGGKFSLYRRIETLQEYVLVSSETQSVEIFRLNPEGIWQFIPYSEEQIVELTSIGLNLSFETIYEDVTLSESPTGSAG